MLKTGRRSRIRTTVETCFYGTVRRACDCCRARKVRCDGSQPCSRCLKSFAECTFLVVPKKKGPRIEQTGKSAPDMVCSDSTKKVGHYQGSSSPSSDYTYTSTGLASEPFSVLLDNPRGEYDGPVAVPSPSDERPSCLQSIDKTAIASPELSGGSSIHVAATMVPGNPRHRDSYYNPYNRDSSAPLPSRVFLPFMNIFFDQLFPIMPVLDRHMYLDSDLLEGDAPLSSGDYSMLAAVSALTVVQLNLPTSFVQQDLVSLSPELLVDECLRERRRYDYIEEPDVSTVLTSFFLFGYYGNVERHNKARHYLHEAISFAESIGLDNEVYLSQLPPLQGQRYRIVFWLLFITERAYALQQENRVKILSPSIKPPAIFESDDPRLLYGFVSLLNVFLVIDSTFLSVWDSTSKRDNLSKIWVIEILRKLEASAITLPESLEKHQLDVSISRQWLQICLWKISAKQGLLTLDANDKPFNLQYPIQLARDAVKTTSLVSQASLDSHGIGMEQKIADIASCLADVLRCAIGDMSEPFRQGRECLMALLLKLSQIRGAQSHYLQPLLEKVDIVTCQMLSPVLPNSELEPIEAVTSTRVETGEYLDDQDYRQWFVIDEPSSEDMPGP